MAIWQFKFDLLPESGFKRLHGGLLPNLSFARSPAGPRLVREAQEEVNYWAGSDPFSLIPDIQTLLPERKSWSEDARMFGNEEGDAVEVWADLVFCAADMRAISKEFLDGILETAIKNELLLVLNENAVV